MALSELIENEDFLTGLAFGVAALAAIGLGAAVRRAADQGAEPTPRPPRRGRARRAAPPTAALGIVAAGLLGLLAAYPDVVTTRLVVGLVLVTVGPFAASFAVVGDWRRSIVAAATAVPGAIVIATAAATQNSFDWIEPFVVFSVVVGGALITEFDRANARSGLGPVLLAVAAFGIYTAVPDTELIAVILGATIPMAFVGFPVALSALGPGAYGVVGLVGWVVASGGRGRPGSVVGAFACLGLLLVEPFVRLVLRGRVRPIRRPVSVLTAIVVAIQCVLAVTIARTAGLEQSALDAAVLALALLGAGALALAVVLYRPRPAGSDSAPIGPDDGSYTPHAQRASGRQAT